ncbi:MAG: hypothetical protein HFACDABA_00448 [Anaerolineales bacterium]|nr:hypothetical protein [Anaerolineales bacterium]
MKVRNRFALLLDLFLIILLVLGWQIVTSGRETDKRIRRAPSVYLLCEAIRWSLSPLIESLIVYGKSQPSEI